MDAALLRYAQERAATWGAERFATEFHKRDLEERWIEAAESHTTPYSPTSEPAPPDMLSGPVDAAVQDALVGPEGEALHISRRAHERHPSVPRAPVAETEPEHRRFRRRDRVRAVPEPTWTISPAEAARMSAAGRRLYGLDDPEVPGSR